MNLLTEDSTLPFISSRPVMPSMGLVPVMKAGLYLKPLIPDIPSSLEQLLNNSKEDLPTVHRNRIEK